MAHVRAQIAPDEEAFARKSLPATAWPLFTAMPVADRRHALDVADRLAAQGHDSPDVLAAALLHDAAKGRRMRLWYRVAGVLLEAFAPSLLRRLAIADPSSWRHPFWLYLHHGPMSAELAAGGGCSPATARLIGGVPAGASEAQLLRALKAADDAS
ncbi:MAG: hypothetical protein LC744_02990 [Chloroflexi bacterium]|nr:hypothetical protein [Chloroflexota bacterium]